MFGERGGGGGEWVEKKNCGKKRLEKKKKERKLNWENIKNIEKRVPLLLSTRRKRKKGGK